MYLDPGSLLRVWSERRSGSFLRSFVYILTKCWKPRIDCSGLRDPIRTDGSSFIQMQHIFFRLGAQSDCVHSLAVWTLDRRISRFILRNKKYIYIGHV